MSYYLYFSVSRYQFMLVHYTSYFCELDTGNEEMLLLQTKILISLSINFMQFSSNKWLSLSVCTNNEPSACKVTSSGRDLRLHSSTGNSQIYDLRSSVSLLTATYFIHNGRFLLPFIIYGQECIKVLLCLQHEWFMFEPWSKAMTLHLLICRRYT